MNLDKAKRVLILCIKYLVSLIIIAVVIGPLLVTLFTSVKTQVQLGNTSAILPPSLSDWTWENYAEVLGAKLLPDAFKNTGIILVISIFFNVMFGSVTAYCLQRFEFRFKKAVSYTHLDVYKRQLLFRVRHHGMLHRKLCQAQPAFLRDHHFAGHCVDFHAGCCAVPAESALRLIEQGHSLPLGIPAGDCCFDEPFRL